jgi:hypothetical protein
LCHAPKLLAFIPKRRQESRSVPDVPALLLAGFDVWPGPSAWARRVSEAVLATAGRYRVLTLSVRTGGLPHSEAVLGARALRVPVGTGPLLERVEAFVRAVQRQLDSDTHALVHTADPFVGAAVLEHPSAVPLLYEAARLPSAALPLLAGPGAEEAVFARALRRDERLCMVQSHAAVAVARSRTEALMATGRGGPVHVLPDGIAVRPQPPRLERGPLHVHHLGWNLSPGAVQLLTEAARALGTEARIHVGQPPSFHWPAEVRRSLAAAVRHGWLTVGEAQTLPPGWADVEVLAPLGTDARAPASLPDALPALADGRPVLVADSEAARAEFPTGCTVFFQASNSAALAAALGALNRDALLRNRAGAEARAYVERVHEPTRVRGMLRDLYRQLGAVRLRRRSERAPFSRALSFGVADLTPSGQALEATDPGTPSGSFG